MIIMINMYMVIFLIFMFMVVFIKFMNHLLMMLMVMEFLIITMVYLFYMYLSIFFQGVLVLFYIVFAVGESVIGLTLIVFVVRHCSSDMTKMMNLNMW